MALAWCTASSGLTRSLSRGSSACSIPGQQKCWAKADPSVTVQLLRVTQQGWSGLGTAASPVLHPEPAGLGRTLEMLLVRLGQWPMCKLQSFPLTCMSHNSRELGTRAGTQGRGVQWPQPSHKGKVTQKSTQAATTGQGLSQAEMLPVVLAQVAQNELTAGPRLARHTRPCQSALPDAPARFPRLCGLGLESPQQVHPQVCLKPNDKLHSQNSEHKTSYFYFVET